MKQKLKKVNIKDFLGFFILIFALPVSLFVRFKNRHNPIWLVCELKDTCRDNGYHFFRYLRINHPEVNAWYAINKKSKDYNKIKEYGNIIQFGSFKHYVYYLSSFYNISSHKEGNPNHLVFTIVHLYLKLFNNRVFLQHGIIKDDAPMFYYKNCYFKYFVCGAKAEYDFILDKFGYPSNNVIYTGLSRFDNLYNCDVDSSKILIMPTWRRWFDELKDKETFMESDYFKNWNQFLNNKDLIRILKENNKKIIFYPHISMKKFVSCFNCNSEYINIITDYSIDLQSILKECSLMITDYSSVYMDFAYMRKPVLYYQFDYDKYREGHFSEGYFDYKENGFGKVCSSYSELLDNLNQYILTNYKIEDEYYKRMIDFFPLHDNKNSERIFKILKNGDKYE